MVLAKRGHKRPSRYPLSTHFEAKLRVPVILVNPYKELMLMIHSKPIERAMSPSFLVASPRLDGSPFERAVILLVHHDSGGAMGYIINKPVDVDFGTLISSVNAEIKPKIVADRFKKAVYFGGPVRLEQMWVLYKRSDSERPKAEPAPGVLPEAFGLAFAGGLAGNPGPIAPDETPIGKDWVLSASGQLIEEFAMGYSEDYFMPVLGYSGWGAGQLEAEIGEGSWLMADFDDSLIRDNRPRDRWTRALEEIGVDPMTFMMMGKVGQA